MTAPAPHTAQRPCRLVLVEGLIGTGKTTATLAVAEALRSAGVSVRTVLEGDVEHPADLEQMAFLTDEAVAALLTAHPGWRDRVASVTREVPGGVLVAYGVLARDHGPVPEDLLAPLRSADAYEQPLGDHRDLRLAQWRAFVAAAARDDVVHVLDCCFLQNPVTVTALRDGAPPSVTTAFVQDLAEAAGPLAPVVLHLARTDVEDTLHRAAAERGEGWLGFVTEYYTGQGLGRSMGAVGTAGLVEVLRRRAALEEAVLDAVGLPVVRAVTADGDHEALGRAVGEVVARCGGSRRGEVVASDA